MKGVARSFWLLVAITFGLEAFLATLAVRSLHRVLSCWWAALPPPNEAKASCGASVFLFGGYSWVPAALIILILLATLTAGLTTFVLQLRRTRKALSLLGPVIPAPSHLFEVQEHFRAVIELLDDPRTFCCCAGLIRRRIIVSTAMLNRLSRDELLAVVAHEMSHVRKMDPARATAVRVASGALFYLPLAKYLAEQSLISAELGADAAAVTNAGAPNLIRALINIVGEVRPVLWGVTEVASLDALDLRIEALKTRTLPSQKPPFGVIFPSILALCALLGLWAWIPASASKVIDRPAHFIVPSAQRL